MVLESTLSGTEVITWTLTLDCCPSDEYNTIKFLLIKIKFNFFLSYENWIVYGIIPNHSHKILQSVFYSKLHLVVRLFGGGGCTSKRNEQNINFNQTKICASIVCRFSSLVGVKAVFKITLNIFNWQCIRRWRKQRRCCLSS